MKCLFIIIFVVFINSCSDRPHIATGLEGKPMPAFNLLLMDSSTRLNTNSIPRGEPIVLFFFTPGCPYCKAQTHEILENFSSLKGIKFCVLSAFPFGQIKKYYADLQLDRYSEIIVGQDYDNFFQKYFNAEGVPYLAIYNKKKQLKQVVSGKVEPDVIKDIALE